PPWRHVVVTATPDGVCVTLDGRLVQARSRREVDQDARNLLGERPDGRGASPAHPRGDLGLLLYPPAPSFPTLAIRPPRGPTPPLPRPHVPEGLVDGRKEGERYEEKGPP